VNNGWVVKSGKTPEHRPFSHPEQSVESQEISMKALVTALALLSFVGAATVPAVAFAQDATSKPAKKKTTAKKHTTKAKKSKKAATQS